MKKSGTEEWYW